MKKLKVIALTLLVSSGLVILPAVSASAHTPAAVGTVTCEEDGTYTVNWVYSQTNTPGGAETDVKVIDYKPSVSDLVTQSGTQWINTWLEHKNGMDVPTNTGNYSVSFSQTNIPGDATRAEVFIQTDYKNGPKSTDVWFDVSLDGKCDIPTPPQPEDKVVTSEWTDTANSCEVPTITQTRTVTTTPFVLVGKTWVEDTQNVTVVTETQTRDKTEEETKACVTVPESILTQDTSELVTCETETVKVTTFFYQSDPIWNPETREYDSFGEPYLIDTTETTREATEEELDKAECVTVVEPPVVEPPIVTPPVVTPPIVTPPVVVPPVVQPPVVVPPVVTPPVVTAPVVEPPVVVSVPKVEVPVATQQVLANTGLNETGLSAIFGFSLLAIIAGLWFVFMIRVQDKSK